MAAVQLLLSPFAAYRYPEVAVVDEAEEPIIGVLGCRVLVGEEGEERPVPGRLLVTPTRVAVVTREVAYGGDVIEYAARVLLAPLNVSFEFSATINPMVRRRIFRREYLLEIQFEDVSGRARRRRVVFATKLHLDQAIRFIREAAAQYQRRPLPHRHVFFEFVEFLATEKGVKPIFIDQVARCIVIGSSWFCLESEASSEERSRNVYEQGTYMRVSRASPEIREVAEHWVHEFLAHG